MILVKSDLHLVKILVKFTYMEVKILIISPNSK